MRQFEVFKKNYEDAVESITQQLESRDAGEEDLIQLTQLFLETDANPYGFCPEGWANSFYSAQGFDSLLRMIRYAMYDDGDITFFVVNDEPKFGFFPAYELNNENCLNSAQKDMVKRGFSTYEYHAVSVAEWIGLFRQYHSKEVRRFFVTDAARFGVEFAIECYSPNSNFDPDWEFDEGILKEIAVMREKFKVAGILK